MMKTDKAENIPLIGVDTGGTFTDLVMVDGQVVRTWKLPSTPDDPARAVLEGVRHLVGDAPAQVFHGSTVATNALLEHKNAKVALVVTAGFRDLLQIGRQNRPVLYALHPRVHPPIVHRDHVIEVEERILFDGTIETALSEEETRSLVDRVLVTGCRSVAICLLHAYANPDHEKRIAEELESAGLRVSASHRVLAEFREFERAATTAVNAAVSPVMADYLERLADGLPSRSLRVMQSNGGAVSAAVAKREAVRTILSGPAGGLVGAFACGRKAGIDRLMTFDMGGTSTDVSLCDQTLATTTETVIAGWPLKVPMIDIHTVGAGGGSIARFDTGGALRVGPESAGASPGPVCYARGGSAVTVTDANLYLGRLLPDRFLDGRMALDVPASRTALETLADQAGIAAHHLAEGILEVAEETMAGALRVVSVQRGHDPREFTLLPFGGAGGLHACALAEKLGIPRILLPAHPGLLSAVGMVLADVIRDYARTVLWGEERFGTECEGLFKGLEDEAVRDMEGEGIIGTQLTLERSVDMRYQGQSFEINVPLAEDVHAAFHNRHEELYGYQDPSRNVEIVTLRLRAVGPGPQVELADSTLAGEISTAENRQIILQGETIDCPVYSRSSFIPGERLFGPALVIEATATHLVRPGWHVMVDCLGNLQLEKSRDTEYLGKMVKA